MDDHPNFGHFLPIGLFPIGVVKGSYKQQFSLKVVSTLALSGSIACVAVFNFVPAIHQRAMDVVVDIEQYAENNKNTSVGLRFEMWRAGVQH